MLGTLSPYAVEGFDAVPVEVAANGDRERGKGSSLNSASLTTKPLASSVYVHVPEAPSPHERPISVTSLFPSLDISNVPFSLPYAGPVFSSFGLTQMEVPLVP